jgi:hypothetical protein
MPVGCLVPWRRGRVYHPAAAQEDARDGQDRRDQTQQNPKGLGKPTEPAKMQVTESQQSLVRELVTGIKKIECSIERLRKSKIDS